MGRAAPAPNLQPLAPATPARSAREPRPRGLVDLRVEARSPPLGAARLCFCPRGPHLRPAAPAHVRRREHCPPPPSPSATKSRTSDTNVPPPSATFALGKPASASPTLRAWALAVRSDSRSRSLWHQARYSPLPPRSELRGRCPTIGAYARHSSRIACWPLEPLRSQPFRLQRGWAARKREAASCGARET